MDTPRSPVRVCIVGGGAQTEQAYLPTLSRLASCEIASLIDIDLDKGRDLASRYRIPHHGRSIDDIPDGVQAAFVVLPHHLHAPVSSELLRRKLHVLSEKPMATTLRDATTMVQSALDHGVQLTIGNIFRFYWTSRRIKQFLMSQELGRLVSFHIEDGKLFNWPTASGFYFDKAQAGGGVLIDTGAHVLDLLLWWLQDYPTALTYQDDNWGGVEAECHLELKFSSAHGSVRLSRLRDLRNEYSLTFEGGTVVFRPYDPSGICNLISLQREDKLISLTADHPRRYHDYFAQQLESFLDSVRNGTPSQVPGESVLPSIRLIEDCYRNASRLGLHPVPNGSPAASLPPSDQVTERPRAPGAPRGARPVGSLKILVTGASGLIGGRLAERLSLEYGNPPRVLLRNFNKAAGICRLPVEAVVGDLLDYPSLVRATAGCHAVIHCAYGNTLDDRLNVRINTQGTENIIRASRANKVQTFIHLSSVEVYGRNQPPVVDEDTPPQPSAYSYGDSKLEAEKICLRYHAECGFPVAILRLSAVYGPYALWTVDVINRLLHRGFCKSPHFDGLCNPLYIDDAVDAIVLALGRPGIAGQTFLISGGETLTWNEYFEAYNQMLGLPPLRTAGMLELRFYRVVRQAWDFVFDRLTQPGHRDMVFRYKALRERGRVPNLRALLRRGSLLLAHEVLSRRTQYSPAKALRELGFQPRHDFATGMSLIKQWYCD